MKYNYLFEDEEGNSLWKDETVALKEMQFAPPAKAIEISQSFPGTAALFLRLRTGWNEPVHPTPIWQTLIGLRGVIRVTASNGETREIGPGDVWMMADCNGKGHHTEVISPDDFECMIVQHESPQP